MEKFVEDIKSQVYSLFKHYDTASNGFWGPEEAAAFFGHYAEHFPITDITVLRKENEGKAMIKMFSESGDNSELQEAVDKGKQKIIDEMPQQLRSYQENKKARNDQAFKTLDTNGDNQIELSELVAAMTPNHPKRAELDKALGLKHGEAPSGESGCALM